MRRFAPETAGVATAQDAVPLISARVRQSVDRWAKTGEVGLDGKPAVWTWIKDPPSPSNVKWNLWGDFYYPNSWRVGQSVAKDWDMYDPAQLNARLHMETLNKMEPAKPAEYIREHYTKGSVLIPMRDGTRAPHASSARAASGRNSPVARSDSERAAVSGRPCTRFRWSPAPSPRASSRRRAASSKPGVFTSSEAEVTAPARCASRIPRFTATVKPRSSALTMSRRASVVEATPIVLADPVEVAGHAQRVLHGLAARPLGSRQKRAPQTDCACPGIKDNQMVAGLHR